MPPSNSIPFAIAAFKDHLIVLSCSSNPSNYLSGNKLSLSPAKIKYIPFSTSLTVVSISLSIFLYVIYKNIYIGLKICIRNYRVHH